MFGLLIATEMRIGEAIALDRADFDGDLGTLIIRPGKFGKSSELPLHPSTTSALTGYLRRRDARGSGTGWCFWRGGGPHPARAPLLVLTWRYSGPMPAIRLTFAHSDRVHARGKVPALFLR